MHDSPISRKEWLISLIIGIFFGLLALLKHTPSAFVVFCDVGQGDGSYIHLPPNFDILIDAGKDSSVVSCIGKYMPLTDRTIELAFITHFQIDHYGGYLPLLKRYEVKQIIFSSKPPQSDHVATLLSELKKQKTEIIEMYAGDELRVNDAYIKMLWPTEEALQNSTYKEDPNHLSQVMEFTRQGHKLLYTGDISPVVLHALSKQAISQVDIMKVPHHGSKKGLTPDFLLLAEPTYTVISVGRKNSYGHPSPETLLLLKSNRSQILRTDKMGDIWLSLE